MKTSSLKFYQKLVIGSFVVFAVASCNQAPTQTETVEPEPAKPTAEEKVARGQYLVMIGGCNDCHTPKVFGPEGPKLDMDKMLSGHPADMPIGKYDPAIIADWALLNHQLTAAAGPWGVSFSANLTSDETGIGNWTLEQFTRAIREGKSKGLEGGRTLLPPMPWEGLANLTNEDIEAIFMYLKSTKPVRNIPPNPIPPAGA